MNTAESFHPFKWDSPYVELSIPSTIPYAIWEQTGLSGKCLPGHGLCGEELQFVVVQTETGESEEPGKGLDIEIVQRVVTKTEPFDVLQALQESEVPCSTRVPTATEKGRVGPSVNVSGPLVTWKAKLGM